MKQRRHISFYRNNRSRNRSLSGITAQLIVLESFGWNTSTCSFPRISHIIHMIIYIHIQLVKWLVDLAHQLIIQLNNIWFDQSQARELIHVWPHDPKNIIVLIGSSAWELQFRLSISFEYKRALFPSPAPFRAMVMETVAASIACLSLSAIVLFASRGREPSLERLCGFILVITKEWMNGYFLWYYLG